MINYEKNLKQIFIFSDFDATISQNDLTDVLFEKYGDFRGNLAKLINGTINIFEYWKEFIRSLPTNFFDNELQEFIKEEQIDPYFLQFYIFCKNENLPISIVTDNFDKITEPYLNYNKIEDFKLYSNKIKFEANIAIPIFPFASEGCEECMSAVCKRNVIISNVPDEAIVVYIGDGFSDHCAANYSDIIFAKKSLAKYCSENRIPHYNFSTFFDIKMIFEKLLKENKIRPRYQAHLNRKRAFEAE
ncbi:MAG: MtnX-like HAD-IB family phosphatase [Candidatus Kapaibacteriota bacterium]